MINPYFCYAFAFSIALALYFLGWSDLYPPFSIALLIFLLLTILIHALAGIKFASKKIVWFLNLDIRNERSPLFVTLFLFALWCAEFLYEGGVPLLKILLKQPYDYKMFGIPTLHVFIVTFSSFYTIYLFHIYLCKRSFSILGLYIINLLAAILIFNRGMLFFNISASAFLFFIHAQKFSIKQVLWGITGLVVFLFLFGVLGSLRVSNESRIPYTNEEFLQTGHANRAFVESGVPHEFFWTYIYTTSPLANLQHNITASEPPQFNFVTFAGWLNNEILFDFISKRINKFARKEPKKENRIPGPFNATTIYSRSFSYLGWWGLIFMGITILVVPLLFVRILPSSSPFFLTSFAILNTIFLFMVFENTLRFTGLSFQMVYPVLLHFAIQRSSWLKKIFL